MCIQKWCISTFSDALSTGTALLPCWDTPTQNKEWCKQLLEVTQIYYSFILHKHHHCKGWLINCTKPIITTLYATSHTHTKKKKEFIYSQILPYKQQQAGPSKRNTKFAEQNFGGGLASHPPRKKPMEGKTLWDKTPHTGKTQINTCSLQLEQ